MLNTHLSQQNRVAASKFDLFVFHELSDLDCYILRASLNDATPCNFSASAVQMLRVSEVHYKEDHEYMTEKQPKEYVARRDTR